MRPSFRPANRLDIATALTCGSLLFASAAVRLCVGKLRVPVIKHGRIISKASFTGAELISKRSTWTRSRIRFKIPTIKLLRAEATFGD
ncbi:hypothetical protein AAMO2058_001335800 [Amorphochlora amoebiformis]